MSSVPQVSPSVAAARPPAGNSKNLGRTLPESLPVPKPRILMVGRNTSWGAPLQLTLRELGCDFAFAPSLRATPDFVRKKSVAVLLLDSTVPPTHRRKLAAALAGSNISIFQLFPVENDCWWLPALLKGEDCFGSPGFRSKELPVELSRVLPNSD
ncbi:MAG: hypothetical protein LAO08_09005 [Acidobacteriia bacterium]|nr:hypothetical protein [Terriglobia bacterium]